MISANIWIGGGGNSQQKEVIKALFFWTFIAIVETINYEDAIPTQRLRKSAIGLQTDSTVLRDMVGGSGDVFIVTNSFLMLVTAY